MKKKISANVIAVFKSAPVELKEHLNSTALTFSEVKLNFMTALGTSSSSYAYSR